MAIDLPPVSGERERIVEALHGWYYSTVEMRISAAIPGELAEYIAALLPPGSVTLRGASPPTWDPPAVGGYHDYSLLANDIEQLESTSRGVISSFSIGQTAEGREIIAFRILATTTNPTRKILLVGGHHACERISVEVPLLVGAAIAEARLGGCAMPKVDMVEFVVVPMLNPDGHEFFNREHTTHVNWRKNMRPLGNPYSGFFGVDLNRNYDFYWSLFDSSTAGPSPNYCGPCAFSEPETIAMRKLLVDEKMDALLSYHSFGQNILYPWGYTEDMAVVELQALAEDMVLSSRTAGGDYTAVQASKVYNTYIGGELCDWALARLGIPGLTVELPPASGDPGFWLPATEIQSAFDGHYPAALKFAERIVDGWTSQSG